MNGFLLDSNLIIYGAQPDGEKVREFIKEHAPQVSVISKVETLGYHSLEEEERAHLERFFEAAIVLPVSDDIIGFAIELRQRRSISLGDSLIAATALSSGLTLATHNISDFEWIEGLKVVDPFASGLK